MAELSFPLENTEYGAQDAQLWFSSRTSGVYAGTELPVSAAGGMSVTVGKGRAWMAYAEFAGIVYANLTAMNVDAPTSDAYYDRIDRVVIRFDRTANTVGARIISGTPATDAQPPALTRNDSVYEISLAQIRIKKGATEISAADIMDERLDSTVCGIMSDGVTGIDLSVIDAQWKRKLKELEELLLDIPNGTAPNAENLNGKPPEYYTAYKMLGDNMDFNHFVAQAGIGGMHGAQSYAGDRWMLVSGSVSGKQNENGDGYSNVVLNGTIRQFLSNVPENVTVFVGMKSGNAEAVYENGAITITSNGGVIDYVHAIEGVVDSEPPFIPRSYAAELIECQRYFYKLSGNAYITFPGYASSATQARITMKMPIPMRTTPTISVSDVTQSRIFHSASSPVTSISVGARVNDMIALIVSTSGLSTNEPVALRFNTDIMMSADL